MPAVSEKMVIDQVNQADVPIRHIRRQDVFAEHASFRVAHVLVFNSHRDLLLQRLALTRKRNPGLWGSSVASYLFASESYKSAATRRFSEELGLMPPKLEFAGKTQMADDGCLKFIGIFTTTSEGPFRVDFSHIAAVQFEPAAQIQRMIDDNPQQFTPTFLQVFRYFRNTFEEF